MKVLVKTPSRLHFGIIDLRGDLGRLYGSVGVAIDRPALTLRASPSPELEVVGPRSERAHRYAKRVINELGLKGGARIEVISDIPEHAGFGSGTQLALAVATSLMRLHGRPYEVEELAWRLGRGRRSGVGVYAFKYGGFIVDGGHRMGEARGIPPLIFRSPVPEGWFFVVGLPEIGVGLSSEAEEEAFRRLKPPAREMVGEMARIVWLKMIPAIIEGDIRVFGEAITDLDSTFGDYWMEIQGGRYRHRIIEEGVELLREMGSYGVGQSSWGPAFYGLVEGEDRAREMAEALRDFLRERGYLGDAFHARPSNGGAIIELQE
jgi:beta-RFAP synthase